MNSVKKQPFPSIVLALCVFSSLLCPMNVAGQEQDSSLGTTIMKHLQQVQQYLDSSAQRAVDPLYIEVPVKPWRVIARYKENVVDVDYSNTFAVPQNNASADWSLRFEPPTAASVGFWVGYRGTGVSFSKALAKNAGRYFSISSTGAKYGFNFRLRRFSTSAVNLTATNYKNGEVVQESQIDGDMPSPVWIRSTYLNGYYVFNGRRYSQAAAYSQSVIQRRSAGSFLVGATWFQSSFDYSDIDNTIFMLLGNNVGRIKVRQGNLGLGYGYNWVPFRGFVLNVMAMPTFSIYNRVKVYKYDFNYVIPVSRDTEDDFGEWNPETKTWANGKTHKPLPITEEESDYPTDIDYWEAGSETVYSALQFNLDLRIGIAYNWSRYFIGLQAQYNNFSYKKDQCKVTIADAYARLSLGIRL